MRQFDFDEDLDINFQIANALQTNDINALRQILFSIKEIIDNNSDQVDDYKENICYVLNCFPDLKNEFQYLWYRCGCW
ncbi:MAG: hypothetical protein RMX68_027040 [Aulosira sp. ZfuVER01]|nr:hypothetical protein [Aulosira sp. ZfuVER01]MDZ7996684.1 hypothetical protein [Aulosira sp. DedVER01a]MDZ8053734.1 hypothetical protein [Aulosira sp. ZfuCHP01]